MFRVEEYISRNLQHFFVNLDENMLSTKRKLHFLRAWNSVEESSINFQSSSDADTKVSLWWLGNFSWKSSRCYKGWNGLTCRQVMQKYGHCDASFSSNWVGQSHDVPTRWVFTWYSNEIRTALLFNCTKCFHTFKRNENPPNLYLGLCKWSQQNQKGNH